MQVQNDSDISNIVFVGGGTAGWMAAAAFSKYFNDGQRRFTLVESDAIGTVGVGEATIPPIANFNHMLDISESEFLRATKGSFTRATWRYFQLFDELSRSAAWQVCPRQT